MDIVGIFPLYLPWRRAGAEVMAHALLRGLASRGHSIQVLVVPEIRSDASLPFEEVPLDGIQIKVCTIGELPALLDRSRSIDVIIGQLGASPIAAELARSYRSKYVEVVHADDPRTYRNLISCRPDLTIFNTRLLRDFFLAHCGRSEVLHPPVSPEIHRTHKGSHVTLVNLREDKGVGVFRSVAEQLPDIPFLGVVGGYGVQEQDFPENVTIQQHTQDMRSDVWSRTRILMMPSKAESYGMVALEAAASGIPVIASMLAGIREAMGPSAIYLHRKEIDAWRSHIKRLTEDSEHERELSRTSSARSERVYRKHLLELAQAMHAIESLA
ncbi:glycosyltransferase family 4 protein [Kribbella sp. NPDC059898]|uniref:glycosyltransferase family 4 protein n=1 Tax=Kribbella sp. NPDC059898 TaxID=3346995 RepID=UPI003653D56F